MTRSRSTRNPARTVRVVVVKETADYKIERWMDTADFAAFVVDVTLGWRYLGSRQKQYEAEQLVDEFRFDPLARHGAHALA